MTADAAAAAAYAARRSLINNSGIEEARSE